MVTKLLKESQLREAARIIRDGGLVAFRTETVYGLGANVTNDVAVQKIFTAKGRPSSNPLIVHFYSLKHLKEYFALSQVEEKVLKKVKGALTIVLPMDKLKSPLGDAVRAGQESFAVRIPSCRFARKFIRACKVPIAAPSANTSTRPSPTDWRAVLEDLDGKIDAIVMGRRTKIGIESTVVAIEESKIIVLRQGGISLDTLRRKTGLTVELASKSEDLQKSPGTRFKHYAPSFPVVIGQDCQDRECVVIGQSANAHLFLGKNAKAASANLFFLLRVAEKILQKRASIKEKIIIVENLPSTDEYASVRERVAKAAE